MLLRETVWPAKDKMTTTAMIVMEPGSAWPGPIGDFTNLVAFNTGCEELLAKAQEKLHSLRRAKLAVRVAVLACNMAAGDSVAGPRAQLARLLLSAVAGTTHGRMLLTCGPRPSHSLVQELLALAEALTLDLRGATATVSLRIAEAPRVRTASGPGYSRAHCGSSGWLVSDSPTVVDS